MTPGRVVHVVLSDEFAGVERQVVDTAVELHRRGWQVTVIGGERRAMRAGLPAGTAHLQGRTLLEVGRALHSLGPVDVVHAHMTASELPAVLLRWRHRARLVVTRHFAARRGSSPAGRLARPVIARGVDVQIAISRFVADSIDGPSTVIHNGVRPSTDLDVPRSNAVVVMQRFEREKQTTTALQAWSASGLAARGWRLELYGRGAEGDALLSLTRRLGMVGSVDFRGFVEDPRARLARASIMLATAPAEPFGLSVVEAMAEGTPVVAADGGAHRETLGADGEFFAPGDAAACAELLVRLADSPERRGDVGARLRERQRAGFTITANVDRLERVYAS